MNKSIIIIAFILVAGIAVYFLASGNSDKQKSESKETVVQELTPEEFRQQSQEEPGVVIDVRTQEEYIQGHLARADYQYDLMNGDFAARLDSLDKDQTYYLYCRSGNRSGKAARLMIQKGFNNVYNIGGFQDLVDSGLQEE